MPVLNRIADLHKEITEWRHDFHENPEILYEVHRTAGIVASKLREFGCDEVIEGIGQTGVVGVIHGRTNKSKKTIGLRADMDALPINELNDLPYKSKVPGKMHACGHDGHTAMLLGTAKYLSETRNFDGTAIMIFQPAEEGGAGAKAMIEDGLITRFHIDEVYGLHNMPTIPVGTFAVRKGALMASAAVFSVDIEGKGGHGAMPHFTIDPVPCGAAIVQAFQTVISRNLDAIESGVISVTMFHAGDAHNVIPQFTSLKGTVRTFNKDVENRIIKRMGEICAGIAAAYACKATFTYTHGYPVTFNHDKETDFAIAVAQDVVGSHNVNSDTQPLMGAEDFSYMLEERPGCYIFLGNGDTQTCHHPAYNFDDNAIPFGTSYLARIIEKGLPA